MINRLKKIAVFIADKIDRSGIKILSESGFCILEYPGLSNERLIKKLSAFHSLKIVLIIRSIRRLGCGELEKIKHHGNVVLICTASSGFDNIDTAYAKKLKLKILNVPDGNYISAAEHTIALILSITKNILTADSMMRIRIFDNQQYNNYELKSKTLGIIGVGRVGSYVAKLSRSLGMKILGNDIKKSLKYKYTWIDFVSLPHLLRKSDIVTIHTPLDKSTRDLIDLSKLGMMKKDSILINCARGGIINENALLIFLKTKKLRYAGLDVFENEPSFNREFTKLQNVILTPHIAGKTKESAVRISTQLAQGILKFVKKNEKLFN